MPFTVPASQRQFPLHIHISVVFTLLLLLMGVALGVFNYLQNTRIILDSSQKQFDQIEQDVQLDLLTTYQPLRNTLNLLARNPAVQTDQFDARMELLPTFVQALDDNPALSALYMGDNQGNFSRSALCAQKRSKIAKKPPPKPPMRCGPCNVRANPWVPNQPSFFMTSR